MESSPTTKLEKREAQLQGEIQILSKQKSHLLVAKMNAAEVLRGMEAEFNSIRKRHAEDVAALEEKKDNIKNNIDELREVMEDLEAQIKVLVAKKITLRTIDDDVDSAMLEFDAITFQAKKAQARYAEIRKKEEQSEGRMRAVNTKVKNANALLVETLAEEKKHRDTMKLWEHELGQKEKEIKRRERRIKKVRIK